MGSFRRVQHKPSGSLNFVEIENDGKEGKENDSLGFRPARVEPVDNRLNPKVQLELLLQLMALEPNSLGYSFRNTFFYD